MDVKQDAVALDQHPKRLCCLRRSGPSRKSCSAAKSLLVRGSYEASKGSVRLPRNTGDSFEGLTAATPGVPACRWRFRPDTVRTGTLAAKGGLATAECNTEECGSMAVSRYVHNYEGKCAEGASKSTATALMVSGPGLSTSL